jgi:hypothetical protein
MAIFCHLGSNSARRLAAVQLVDSPAAPFGCIRQHEQVQTGEKLKGERDHRQEAHPVRVLLLCYGDDVDDNGHRKGHGQPAVGLPNPFAPVQCGTSFEDEPDKDRAYLSIHPASGIVVAGTARSSAGKRRYRKLTRSASARDTVPSATIRSRTKLRLSTARSGCAIGELWLGDRISPARRAASSSDRSNACFPKYRLDASSIP